MSDVVFLVPTREAFCPVFERWRDGTHAKLSGVFEYLANIGVPKEKLNAAGQRIEVPRADVDLQALRENTKGLFEVRTPPAAPDTSRVPCWMQSRI